VIVSACHFTVVRFSIFAATLLWQENQRRNTLHRKTDLFGEDATSFLRFRRSSFFSFIVNSNLIDILSHSLHGSLTAVGTSDALLRIYTLDYNHETILPPKHYDDVNYFSGMSIVLSIIVAIESCSHSKIHTKALSTEAWSFFAPVLLRIALVFLRMTHHSSDLDFAVTLLWIFPALHSTLTCLRVCYLWSFCFVGCISTHPNEADSVASPTRLVESLVSLLLAGGILYCRHIREFRALESLWTLFVLVLMDRVLHYIVNARLICQFRGIYCRRQVTIKKAD